MKILILNGPNLNMLGKREQSYYGVKTLDDIADLVAERAHQLDADAEFYQSNHEGALVDYLQRLTPDVAGIIVNAGALTHYGLSLRDALIDARLPIVEVHLSNIHAREDFRRRSVIADIAQGQIAGLGWQGYLFALEYLATHLKEEGLA